MPVGSAQNADLDQRELREANELLAGRSPIERILWARGRFGDSLILSTSFGLHSAVMLHLVGEAAPGTRVLFVDNGYLTPETYQFKNELSGTLDMEVYTYVPNRTRAEREALEGPVTEVFSREGG
ncbi:MAG: phosphoadenosine phosphosulfate reductase family protein, partial [Candidatus Glassbacteria bacterium]|nr:phosphoadenosine phosphosulfate reductase family protein [Candidatus Glassbacteria bacterium]